MAPALDGEQRPHPGQQRPDAPGRATRSDLTLVDDRGSEVAVAPTGLRFRDQQARLFDRRACSLVDTGVDGLYGRSDVYESIAAALGTGWSPVAVGGGRRAAAFPFPAGRWPAGPSSSRADYLQVVPQPDGLGAHLRRRPTAATPRGSLRRGRRRRGLDRVAARRPSSVVLCSATCHPIYPLCTGRLPEGGRHFEVNGYCFRHEPSADPARMQAFHMHELVYVGDPDGAAGPPETRGLERWPPGGSRELGLDVRAPSSANDPFFGCGSGRMLAANQLEEELEDRGGDPHLLEDSRLTAWSCRPTAAHATISAPPFGIETAESGAVRPTARAWASEWKARITLALLHRPRARPRRGRPGAVRASRLGLEEVEP